MPLFWSLTKQILSFHSLPRKENWSTSCSTWCPTSLKRRQPRWHPEFKPGKYSTWMPWSLGKGFKASNSRRWKARAAFPLGALSIMAKVRSQTRSLLLICSCTRLPCHLLAVGCRTLKLAHWITISKTNSRKKGRAVEERPKALSTSLHSAEPYLNHPLATKML